MDRLGALLRAGDFFAGDFFAADFFAGDFLAALRVAAPFLAEVDRFFAADLRVAAPFLAEVERFAAFFAFVTAPFLAALERLAAFFAERFFAAAFLAPLRFAGDFFAALRFVPRPFFFAAIAASPLPESGRRYCANHIDVAGKFRAHSRTRRTCGRMWRLHHVLHHAALAHVWTGVACDADVPRTVRARTECHCDFTSAAARR
ncbi:MAG: hypothetical protein ABJA80_16195 [bacterium]